MLYRIARLFVIFLFFVIMIDMEPHPFGNFMRIVKGFRVASPSYMELSFHYKSKIFFFI